MESAGDFVALSSELTPGMKLRHDDLDGRPVVLVGHEPDGDAAPVVHHADRGIGADRDVDAGAVVRQGFVDGVVDDLVHKVVQTPMPGGADVHARPLANGREALKNLDVAYVI